MCIHLCMYVFMYVCDNGRSRVKRARNVRYVSGIASIFEVVWTCFLSLSRTHTYIHTRYIHACIHHTHTQTERYLYTYLHTYMHTYMHSAHTHAHVHILTYIQAYMHTYMHISVYKYLLTHSHVVLQAVYVASMSTKHIFKDERDAYATIKFRRRESIGQNQTVKRFPGWRISNLCNIVTLTSVSNKSTDWKNWNKKRKRKRKQQTIFSLHLSLINKIIKKGWVTGTWFFFFISI